METYVANGKQRWKNRWVREEAWWDCKLVQKVLAPYIAYPRKVLLIKHTNGCGFFFNFYSESNKNK